MPFYDYACNTCNYAIEVLHSMVSTEELPEEIKEEIKCKTKECPDFGELMSRDYTSISLMGASGGEMMSERKLLRKKQQSKKLRSKRHFKKEVLPNLDETPKIMDHFKQKFKDI